MNKIIISITTIVIGSIVACKSTKNVPVTTSPTGSSAISSNGIMTPTNQQVLAVRSQYPNITLEQLSEGYKLYTGTCTNCHGAKNIYERSEKHWVEIIDDMAPKSSLSDEQKDQLTKYIMSIKASQPKETR